MKVLKTAVVGLGRIGWQFHLPEVDRHDGFELVAVVDPLTARLDEAAERYGVRGHADLATMLTECRPDLVVIASPTPFHVDQAVAAFRAGCDVLCDKPIARSLAETDRMIAAAERAGRKLMAYQPHRTHSDCIALCEIIRRGMIGPVYMIKCAMARWRRRNDWQAFRKHGGGMLYNYGAHKIDQLLYVTGSRCRRASCLLRTIASLGDADDVAKIVIETDTGVILDIDINQAAAWPVPAWHVLGKRGGAIYDKDSKAWKVRYFQEDELPELPLQQGLAAEGRIYKIGEDIPWRHETLSLADYPAIDYYANCHDYFAADGRPLVPIAETRELMRVLDECLASAGLSSDE